MRSTTRLASGRLRIEYGGVLPSSTATSIFAACSRGCHPWPRPRARISARRAAGTRRRRDSSRSGEEFPEGTEGRAKRPGRRPPAWRENRKRLLRGNLSVRHSGRRHRPHGRAVRGARKARYACRRQTGPPADILLQTSLPWRMGISTIRHVTSSATPRRSATIRSPSFRSWRARCRPASACRRSPISAHRCSSCPSSARPRSGTRCCTTGGATACWWTTPAVTGPKGSPRSWPITPTRKASRPTQRATCASPGCATSPPSRPRTSGRRRVPLACARRRRGRRLRQERHAFLHAARCHRRGGLRARGAPLLGAEPIHDGFMERAARRLRARIGPQARPVLRAMAGPCRRTLGAHRVGPRWKESSSESRAGAAPVFAAPAAGDPIRAPVRDSLGRDRARKADGKRAIQRDPARRAPRSGAARLPAARACGTPADPAAVVPRALARRSLPEEIELRRDAGPTAFRISVSRGSGPGIS